MNLEEKISAPEEIADRICRKSPVVLQGTAVRFAHWGDTASNMFIRAMDELGYDLVRKDNE